MFWLTASSTLQLGFANALVGNISQRLGTSNLSFSVHKACTGQCAAVDNPIAKRVLSFCPCCLQMMDLDRTLLHYKPTNPLLHQGSGISVTSIFQDVEKELKRERAVARVASRLAADLASHQQGEERYCEAGMIANVEEPARTGYPRPGRPVAEFASGQGARNKVKVGSAANVMHKFSEAAAARGGQHDDTWGGDGTALQRLPPNKRRVRVPDAEDADVLDHVSDNSNGAPMQAPPKKLRSGKRNM